ncbi:hypothetical protein MKX08_010364 [Trichoderma sp. CBMAI-0020]|nr:hypothetical protein MKX08_010364 [Trichoderma sp. CBMAI-0020]
MISNMKSAFDPNIKEDGTLDEDFEQNQAITDAMICFDGSIPHDEKEIFKRDIGEILMQAANLHLAMMRSKAIFVVKWAGNDSGEGECRYDPEMMMPLQDGIDATSSTYIVELNESPGVWKIGNADGENFDSVMVLCKPVVVVKERKATVVLE